MAPQDYVARRGGYADVDVKVRSPIEQEAVGRNGIFQVTNIAKRSMTSAAFEKMATSPKFQPPQDIKDDPARLEQHYWKNMGYYSPIYGADTPGSLTDPDQEVWNVNKLGTILDTIEEASGAQIMGVNTAYLYFGMWKASFCWHTEDMDLYSINYIHHGAPKTWYCIPPHYAERMELLARSLFPSENQDCDQFLRHKMSLIAPNHLIANGIPCFTTVHREREFMITFPKAFHSGFNHGYNCAESTNFASERWIDYGKAAIPCKCNGDSVRINMDMFIKKYQPDQWVEPPEPEPELDGGKLVLRLGMFGGVKRRRLTDQERAEKEEARAQRHEERETERLLREAERERLHHERDLKRQAKAKRRHEEREERHRLRELERALKRQRRLEEQEAKAALALVRQRELEEENARQEAAAREAERVERAASSLAYLIAINEQMYHKNGGDRLVCSVCNVGGVPYRPKAATAAAAAAAASGRKGSAAHAAAEYQKAAAAARDAAAGASADPDPELLTCNRCKVVVHSGCYGEVVTADTPEGASWLCALCRDASRDVREADRVCALCPNLGGAFKRTRDGTRMVHVSCALWVPETTFWDPVNLNDVIGLDRIPVDRKRLGCKVCGKAKDNGPAKRLAASPVASAPVQCSKGSCVTAFHVTCGMRAGYCFKMGVNKESGQVLCEAFCPRHKVGLDELKVASELPPAPRFAVGDSVSVRLPLSDGTYTPCKIEAVAPRTLYELRFFDGSLATSLEPRFIHLKLPDGATLYSKAAAAAREQAAAVAMAGNGSGGGGGDAGEGEAEGGRDGDGDGNGERHGDGEAGAAPPAMGKSSGIDQMPLRRNDLLYVEWDDGFTYPSRFIRYIPAARYTVTPILEDDGTVPGVVQHVVAEHDVKLT